MPVNNLKSTHKPGKIIDVHFYSQLVENPHAGTVSDEQLLSGFREQLRLETKELIPVEPIMSMQNDSEKMVCLLPLAFRRMREGCVLTGVCLCTWAGGTQSLIPDPAEGEGDTPGQYLGVPPPL